MLNDIGPCKMINVGMFALKSISNSEVLFFLSILETFTINSSNSQMIQMKWFDRWRLALLMNEIYRKLWTFFCVCVSPILLWIVRFVFFCHFHIKSCHISIFLKLKTFHSEVLQHSLNLFAFCQLWIHNFFFLSYKEQMQLYCNVLTYRDKVSVWK